MWIYTVDACIHQKCFCFCVYLYSLTPRPAKLACAAGGLGSWKGEREVLCSCPMLFLAPSHRVSVGQLDGEREVFLPHGMDICILPCSNQAFVQS